MSTSGSEVTRLTEARLGEAADVFAAAFRDYPVMRFVLGPEGADDAGRLRALVTYFTERRFLRGHLVLGVRREGALVAAANVDPPARGPVTDALRERTTALRALVGDAAMERLDLFATSADPYEPAGPHWHLGMIGVRPEWQGHGLGRILLEHVHALSAADPTSLGVTLTTERPGNVELYRHFGYEVLGRATLPGLESWVMVRR